MDQKSILELASRFVIATGVELIILDQSMMFTFGSTAKLSDSDLQKLDFPELLQHLQSVREVTDHSDREFESHITDHQFIYNIHAIKSSNDSMYYLLTEPMIVQPFTEQVMEMICNERQYSIADKLELARVLTRVPIISWQRICMLGMVLQMMIGSFSGNQYVYQRINDAKFDLSRPILHDQELMHATSLTNKTVPDDQKRFMKVKAIIQAGDIDALNDIEKIIDFADIEMVSQGTLDLLRSVKNYFIFICVEIFNFTTDAGLPFSDMRILSAKLINESEQMTNPRDVIAQMKKAMILFTKAVHDYQIKHYSRPIFLVLAYIRDNYNEKITLESVAKHVGMNASYLSSLIKKETGLTLSDHINRVRIEASKDDLVHSSRSVNEIAQNAGFTYQNYYAKIFKRLTGYSPLEYREQRRIISNIQ